jgi:hypothetical protein
MSLYYNGYYNASYPSLVHSLVDAPVVAAAAPNAAIAAPYWPHHGYYGHPFDFGVDSTTAAEIENRVQAVASTQRPPVVKKEVIPVPGPLGRIRNLVRRLPTPAPGK